MVWTAASRFDVKELAEQNQGLVRRVWAVALRFSVNLVGRLETSFRVWGLGWRNHG